VISLQAAENEIQAKEEIREQYAASERRAIVLAGEIEELRTQLEAAERARKAAESELHEASDRVNELSASNSSIAAQKRKLDNDIQAMQVSFKIAGELQYCR
jgi:chromosome segregation ATPase